MSEAFENPIEHEDYKPYDELFVSCFLFFFTQVKALLHCRRSPQKWQAHKVQTEAGKRVSVSFFLHGKEKIHLEDAILIIDNIYKFLFI